MQAVVGCVSPVDHLLLDHCLLLLLHHNHIACQCVLGGREGGREGGMERNSIIIMLVDY